MKEMNYKPNTLAKAMRTQKSNHIGVIISDITDPFFAELYIAIEEVVKKQGYKTILFNIYDGDPQEVCENLFNWNIDGAVFCFNGNVGKWDELTKDYPRKIPVVHIEDHLCEGLYDRVGVNIEEGMYQAVKHLTNQGLRSITFLGRRPGWPDPRSIGYKRALRDAGIEVNEKLMIECELDMYGGQSAAEELLNMENSPDAVVTVNDSIACGAIKHFLRRGIRIPEDISIIGYNDDVLAKMFYPELTTVRIPIKRVGQGAARILMKRIKNKEEKVMRLDVSTEFISRETTT